MKKVLITGASGLIGTRLTDILLQHGFGVHTLGRTARKAANSLIRPFTWDIEKGVLDERAFEGVSAIVHLAGAGIAERRWTDQRKREIIDTRVKSAHLLYQFLKSGNHEVKTFVSTSGVDYYEDAGENWITEEGAKGKGFLTEVCSQWEQGAIDIGALGIREVRLRTGIVLSAKGGALPPLTATIPFGFATYFAKTPLYYPWIHIDDECGIIMDAINNETMHGPYNSVAPQPLPMKDLMKEILLARKSKAVLLPVPPFTIRLALGEMSAMLLGSHRCSAEKILAAGYRFKYGEIKEALDNILR